MKGTAGVAWLTIQIREPSDLRLDERLAELVTRAHAFGLKAATIAQPVRDAAVPRQPTSRVISLPDGVAGTVTIADSPDQLRAFAAGLGDLLGVDARVELAVDGVARELEVQALSMPSCVN